MPSITSNTPAAGKTEKIPLMDVPEAFKQAASIVEKKCRNLEKRKGKLDGYREEASKGKKLSEDKQQAVAHFNEVVATLDLTREFIQQFEKIGIDASKEEKKRKKKESFERAQLELTRLKELFTIQEVFSCLRSETSRDDFINGCRGAPQFSETDLQKLDAFFSHISLDRSNLSNNFNDAVTNTATHFQRLLDGYNKEVAGTTYREMKDLIQRVITAGYFDWKPQPEVMEPEPTKEPEMEAPHPGMHSQEMYRNIAEERPYVDAGFEYIEPPAPLPTMPQVHQSANYFPVEVETDFNFIQESLIDAPPALPMVPPTSVPMAPPTVPVSLASMDSAVMMVHSQVPPAHLAAYSFLSGNPAAAAAAAASLYGSAPLVSAPSSTLSTAELIAESARTASPVAPPPTTSTAAPADAPQVNSSTNATTATTTSTWAEEPQDEMPPFQQDQNRAESNTWTNSNFRSNDQDSNGRRGGYRNRGSGGPRGSRGGNSGSSGYYNSRNEGGNGGGYRGGERQGQSGDRSDRNDRYQGNGGGERNGTDRGGYQQRDGGDRDRSNYQNNNGGGRYQNSNGGYQGNNQGSYGGNRSERGGGGSGGERSNYAPRGGFRGGSSVRGAPPRGGGSSSRGGGYDRNSSYARE